MVRLFLLLMSIPLFGQQTWLWSEDVTLQQRQATVDDLTLTGGRIVKLVSDDERLAMAGAWPGAKPLLLAFAVETGPVLVDPANGAILPVIFIEGKHPIDLLLDRCIGEFPMISTFKLTECGNQSSRLWEAEVQRLHQLISSRSKPDQRAALQTAQLQWKQFYEAQINVDRLIYVDDLLAETNRTMAAASLKKEQAVRLARLYRR